MLIVLNKTDLIPADERELKLQKVRTRIQKQLSGTKFAAAQFVAVAAAPGASSDIAAAEQINQPSTAHVCPHYMPVS